MLIASLSLVAFPFMTGFYSKDFILESTYGQFYCYSTVVYIIATIGAIFTTLYSVKILYLTFLTSPNGPLINYKQVHEGDIYINLPLIMLALLSMYFGYITKDIFIGLGSGFFSDNSLFIHPLHEIMLDTEFAVPSKFKLLPLALTVSVTIIYLVLSELLANRLVYFKFTRLGYNVFSFLNKRFYIELFYNKYITGLIFKLGGQTTKVLDKGSVELLGPYGLEKGLINLSKNIASLDIGIVTSYALYILIGLISYLLILYIYPDNNSLLFLILSALLAIIVLDYNRYYLFNGPDKYYITMESGLNLNFLSKIKITTILGIFITSLIGFFVRYLLLKYNIDVLHALNFPAYCLSFLTLLGLLRCIIISSLEQLFPNYFFFLRDNSSTGSGANNNNITPQAEQTAEQAAVQSAQSAREADQNAREDEQIATVFALVADRDLPFCDSGKDYGSLVVRREANSHEMLAVNTRNIESIRYFVNYYKSPTEQLSRIDIQNKMSSHEAQLDLLNERNDKSQILNVMKSWER